MTAVRKPQVPSTILHRSTINTTVGTMLYGVFRAEPHSLAVTRAYGALV